MAGLKPPLLPLLNFAGPDRAGTHRPVVYEVVLANPTGKRSLPSQNLPPGVSRPAGASAAKLRSTPDSTHDSTALTIHMCLRCQGGKSLLFERKDRGRKDALRHPDGG